ncbi:hypothetical protein V6N13_079603 [Hibiscus sabdariffa]|uniref:Uncharacterized protein n=1 Tax=Hibiscus sabdariffa TaxID=183260 RepID=A0ABR2RSA8_9ROSI
MTLQKELAIAILESESSPRCPAIIKDVTCRRYCNSDIATKMAAMEHTFLSSFTKLAFVVAAHMLPSFGTCSSAILTKWSNASVLKKSNVSEANKVKSIFGLTLVIWLDSCSLDKLPFESQLYMRLCTLSFPLGLHRYVVVL